MNLLESYSSNYLKSSMSKTCISSTMIEVSTTARDPDFHKKMYVGETSDLSKYS